MITIKSRARSKETNEIVYGIIFDEKTIVTSNKEFIEIKPETISHHFGQIDIKGKEIYTGHIIKVVKCGCGKRSCRIVPNDKYTVTFDGINIFPYSWNYDLTDNDRDPNCHKIIGDTI